MGLLKTLTGYYNNRFGSESESNDPAVVDGNAELGYTVTSTNISIHQLLDVLNGSGDDGLNYVYKPRLYTRNLAICQATLFRAVSLISQITAQLLTEGSYRIVTMDGKKDTSQKANAVRRLFAHTFDGFDPAATTIQKAMADYLLDGNFLFLVNRDGMGNVTELHRLISWSATVYQQSEYGWDYEAEPAEFGRGTVVHANQSRIVHGRWPQLQRTHPNNSGRQNFSIAPVQVMRPAFKAGLALDQYVLKFAERGAYQNIVLNTKEETDFEMLTEQDRNEIKAHIKREQEKERGFTILQEMNSVSDMTPKIDVGLAALRAEQRKEIGIVYGLPGPIIGDQVTSWGSGIAELGRLAKTYGFSLHVKNFCDAIAFRCLNPGSRIEVEYHKLLQMDAAGIKNLIDALRGGPGIKPLATEAELRRIANLQEEYEGELICNPTPNGQEMDANGMIEDQSGNDAGDMADAGPAGNDDDIEDADAEMVRYLTHMD